jgi:hypothetical protein
VCEGKVQGMPLFRRRAADAGNIYRVPEFKRWNALIRRRGGAQEAPRRGLLCYLLFNLHRSSTMRLDVVLWHTVTLEIQLTDAELRPVIAPIGSPAEPPHCFAVVFRHAIAFEIPRAEKVLRNGVALSASRSK